MATISVEQTPDQARTLLDSKIESVTALVKAKQCIADLDEQLVDANENDKRAHLRATRDGRTTDQLKSLGLKDSAAGRQRRAVLKTTETAPEQQQPENAELRQI